MTISGTADVDIVFANQYLAGIGIIARRYIKIAK
jgi:hypothetical protein